MISSKNKLVAVSILGGVILLLSLAGCCSAKRVRLTPNQIGLQHQDGYLKLERDMRLWRVTKNKSFVGGYEYRLESLGFEASRKGNKSYINISIVSAGAIFEIDHIMKRYCPIGPPRYLVALIIPEEFVSGQVLAIYEPPFVHD